MVGRALFPKCFFVFCKLFVVPSKKMLADWNLLRIISELITFNICQRKWPKRAAGFAFTNMHSERRTVIRCFQRVPVQFVDVSIGADVWLIRRWCCLCGFCKACVCSCDSSAAHQRLLEAVEPLTYCWSWTSTRK